MAKKREATFFFIPESRSVDIDTPKDLLEFKKKLK